MEPNFFEQPDRMSVLLTYNFGSVHQAANLFLASDNFDLDTDIIIKYAVNYRESWQRNSIYRPGGLYLDNNKTGQTIGYKLYALFKADDARGHKPEEKIGDVIFGTDEEKWEYLPVVKKIDLGNGVHDIIFRGKKFREVAHRRSDKLKQVVTCVVRVAIDVSLENCTKKSNLVGERPKLPYNPETT